MRMDVGEDGRHRRGKPLACLAFLSFILLLFQIPNAPKFHFRKTRVRTHGLFGAPKVLRILVSQLRTDGAHKIKTKTDADANGKTDTDDEDTGVTELKIAPHRSVNAPV